MSVTNTTIPDKTAERRQIESFTSFITLSFFLYLNYNTTFYVHICTSKMYRTEVKQLILKLIRKTRRDIEQTDGNALGVANQMQT